MEKLRNTWLIAFAIAIAILLARYCIVVKTSLGPRSFSPSATLQAFSLAFLVAKGSLPLIR